MHASEPADYRFETLAVPDAIAWSRTFTSAVATALGVDAEVAADLKLTFSELVSESVITHAGATLVIEGRTSNGSLEFELSPWIGVEPDHRTLSAWDLASTLFDLERSDGSVTVRLDVPPS